MGDQPKFSIVIPTYNRQDFIMATLDTVFEQTYKDFEVIVVDNASTDNTIELLTPLAEEKRIRLIRHDRNYERAKSRNTGMDAAQGDYLTLLDSDDFMYPECLADAATYAIKNPEIKCFHNLYELVDDGRKVLHRYKAPALTNRFGAIAQGNFMACIGNFMHKDLYKRYRFDTNPDLTGGEDWEFWLRVIADFEVGRINKRNCGVQHHGARTINNQNVDEMERGLKYLVQKFRDDAHLSKVYRDYLDRIEANCFLYLNVLANDGKMRKPAFSYLGRSLRADPSVVFTERFLRSLRRTVMT